METTRQKKVARLIQKELSMLLQKEAPGFLGNIMVSVTIAGSMMLVIVVAALVGTFVPIVLNKQGIDPAIATGPFITTANDIFGIFLFFYIAKFVLGF